MQLFIHIGFNVLNRVSSTLLQSEVQPQSADISVEMTLALVRRIFLPNLRNNDLFQNLVVSLNSAAQWTFILPWVSFQMMALFSILWPALQQILLNFWDQTLHLRSRHSCARLLLLFSGPSDWSNCEAIAPLDTCCWVRSGGHQMFYPIKFQSWLHREILLSCMIEFLLNFFETKVKTETKPRLLPSAVNSLPIENV